jgi:hypothetical protein
LGRRAGLAKSNRSADGERFLVNAPVVKSPSVSLSLVLDWPAGLKK